MHFKINAAGTFIIHVNNLEGLFGKLFGQLNTMVSKKL